MTATIPPAPPDRRPVWGDQPRRPGPLGLLIEGSAVLVSAARLLARHWPVLLAIFLAGVLVRELSIRAAVAASLLNAQLGMLVLLLAPMSTLTALVLMLRAVRGSLPRLGSPAYGAPPPLLEYLGSVLVPFLTIYYFEAYLRDDLREYDARVVISDIEREFAQLLDEDPAVIDTADRLSYELSLPLVAVVLVAILARWALTRWGATQRHRWLGIPGAYLELVWLTLVYLAFMGISEEILSWGGDRRLVQGLRSGWQEAVGTLAGFSQPFAEATSWFNNLLGQANSVIVVPIAWLAVGAVVLGHQPASPLASLTTANARSRTLYQGANSRWLAAPRALRWLTGKVTADLVGRFRPLGQGAQMLWRGGLAPMLLFCLAFVAARAVEDWLWQLQRLVIGPQDIATVWLPIADPLLELNRAVSYVLLICLLAAAIDRAVPAVAPPPPADQSTSNLA